MEDGLDTIMQSEDPDREVEVDEENMESDVEEIVESQTKRGPPVHTAWRDAFDDPNVFKKNKPNNAICKNCKDSVRHHHKLLSVKTHLKRCKPFKKLMMNKQVADRPQWWNEMMNKKKGSGSSKSSSTSFASTSAQPSVRSFAIPVFNAAQQKKFNHEMALFFYNTGTSFYRIEDPYLLSAIQLARPQAKLPTRKQLANDSPGGLLQECYEEVKDKVDSLLSKPNQFISITSDAWSNIANESVVNYMAVCPSKSLFLESVNTEEQGHDAEWLAQDISRVIDGIGENVVGAITDNTAANKKMWGILEEKYPANFFHGCVSHGLHLLVKDVFGAKKKEATRGGAPQFPDGYPFEELQLFSNDCKEVVTFFNNHHVMKAKLKKALAAAKLSALVKPAETRWGTLIGCFKSLKAADSILNALVSERDFVNKGTTKQKEKRVEIKEILTDPDFVSKLDESIKILAPIEKYIKIFQSDSVPCSDVYQAFLDLEKQMKNLPNVNEDKRAYLVKLVQQRFEFMYGDAHGVSYLLDPRYLGDGMERKLRKEIEDFVYEFPNKDGNTNDERKKQMAEEYTAFRVEALNEKQQESFRFKLIGKSKTILQWWLADGTDWPLLQNLALRVFSLAASSAASERNFSTFGFVHSKLRNRLDQEKVRKLVYIKTNMTQMTDVTSEGYDSDISGSDDE